MKNLKFLKKPATVLATSFILGTGFVVTEGIFGEPLTVEAASTTTYTVTASALNVRSGAGTNHKVLGTVKKGATLSVSSKSNGWYKINYNGKTGYVSASYVKESTSSSNSSSSTTNYTVTASSLNVRSGAGTKYSTLGTLKKNQSISVSSVSNGWAKFSYNGKTAYASTSYLSKSSSSSSDSSNSNSSTSNVNTYTVTASSLNVRSGAGTSYSILGYLKKNQSISVSSVSNGWAKFSYNGKTAYVSTSYLSKSSSSSSDSSNSDSSASSVNGYTVTASSLNVRSGAGVSHSILGYLKKNQSVSVSSISNGWAKISYNGKTAYVNASYLSKNNSSGSDSSNNNNNNNNNNSGSNSGSDSSTEANSNSPLYKKAIVLDAGHGGKDPGAIGVNGIYEKDVNLSIVQQLSSLLEKEGAVVILTRSNDTYLTLDERVGVVNNSNGEAFLSVHANAAGSEGANGAETYYFGQSRGSSSSESQRLAACIQEAMIAELGAKDRGVKEGNFQVIRETKIPGALVETGFLTNKEEAEKLATDEYQKKVAQALYTGLINYFKN